MCPQHHDLCTVHKAAPRLEAAIVRCSSSTECCQEFPAADPDRSGWNPTLQVPDSASVFDLKIPPPDLRPEIRPSRSSSEDIEALNPIVLDTTEPYQTTIMLSHADTRLPRNVSFEKAQIPSYAEATAIENLPRTSPPAVSSQHTMFAHDSSPEATGSTTSGSSAVVFMPNHELRPISFQEMAQTSSWLPRRASRCSSVHQRRWDKHQRFQCPVVKTAEHILLQYPGHAEERRRLSDVYGRLGLPHEQSLDLLGFFGDADLITHL
ncbi:hypothetical protein MRX96_008091 [Rhipicephalus microplus]